MADESGVRGWVSTKSALGDESFTVYVHPDYTEGHYRETRVPVLVIRDSPDVVVVSRADVVGRTLWCPDCHMRLPEDFDGRRCPFCHGGPHGGELVPCVVVREDRAALATEEPTKARPATPPADEGGTDG